MKTIVRMEFGSKLYGTQTPTSDVDYAAIHIPEPRDILLMTAKPTISHKRIKAHGRRNLPGEIDEESYALHRWFQLLAEGQTVALDMLFAPESAILETTPAWERIQRDAEYFLSRKSAAFISYCRRQANKYGIKGSRVAAARAASVEFAELVMSFGPKVRIRDHWPRMLALCLAHPEHIHTEDLAQGPHHTPVKHIVICNRKLPCTVTLETGLDLANRILKGYGDRAIQAENDQGVDWKALSHAVRVGRQACDLLTHGRYRFPLPYASHLVRIKQGLVPYKEVSQEIEDLFVDVEKAAAESQLPDEPWVDKMNAYVTCTYADAVVAWTKGSNYYATWNPGLPHR